MIAEIIGWIDKKLEDISDTPIFKKYFAEIDLNKDENTFYLTNKSKGIEIVLSINLVITSIHLFSGNDGRFQKFLEDLPFNINFTFDLNDVHEIFGKPNKSGGGHKALYIGYVPFWDKYYFDGYSLHFQYLENKPIINTITIASLKLEDYFNSESQ